ncbi:hypothetical protein CL617_05530 [archaeon]|nr:hypothetical protein [archaeon]|tara:strand:+ start:10074 stop:10430 length:357 start_codon:yes stop_codon:yes gene_type:complete
MIKEEDKSGYELRVRFTEEGKKRLENIVKKTGVRNPEEVVNEALGYFFDMVDVYDLGGKITLVENRTDVYQSGEEVQVKFKRLIRDLEPRENGSEAMWLYFKRHQKETPEKHSKRFIE